MNKNKWFLNGGRVSGRTFRLLCETYENKIADLEEERNDYRDKYETVKNESEVKIAELEQENKTLRNDNSYYLQTIKTLSRKLKQNVDLTTMAVDTVEEWKKKAEELEAQIEKMKSDVMGNIKWADQNKNNQMYCKLNSMFNQWEIKEK